MSNIPPFALVVPAAGSSVRFNSNDLDTNVKKEFLRIDGHTVLYRAVEPFFELDSLKAVVIAAKPGSEKETAYALEELANESRVPLLIVPGGSNRTYSVKNAVERLKNLPVEFDYVAIHDGARPFVTPEIIIKTLATASVATGAASLIPVVDSLKRLNEKGEISEHIDKTSVYTMQSPLIFKWENLYEAFQHITGNETDDMEVYTNAGYKASYIKGYDFNRKITHFDDIKDAREQIDAYKKEVMRSYMEEEAIREFKKGL